VAVRAAAIVAGLAVAAAGAYAVARETAVFAVQTIQISGGSPRVQAEVRKALAPELGRSLIAIGGTEIADRVDPIPDVVSIRFDRSFPHTLHVMVRAERAVLLLRQRRSSWVVSSRGRVMRQVRTPRRSSLPRLWLPAAVPVKVGEKLPADDGSLAAAALAPIAPGAFRGGVRTVVSGADKLTLVLGTGAQVRLGDLGDLRLKLTIARRILTIANTAGAEQPGSYVDVSVPERPVLGSANSQVEGTA
jgi:cell division protein FtsQ